jgi:hypothetical protein
MGVEVSDGNWATTTTVRKISVMKKCFLRNEIYLFLIDLFWDLEVIEEREKMT